MTGRRYLAAALFFALFAGGVGQVAAQSSPRTYCFAVMGEVPAPGVYEWPEPNPLLIDVIRRAGSLTDAASGNIRIVRNGRGGQRAFYSPQLDFRLLPGDVAIAEPAAHARPAPNAPVQVALLDLLDRPVVVPLRPHHASVPAIVSLLNQPPEAAAGVRVLDGRPHPNQAASPEADSLASGIVLVFDRSLLRPERIPNNLPQPIPVPDARRPDTASDPRREAPLAHSGPRAATAPAGFTLDPAAPRELADAANAASPIVERGRAGSPYDSAAPRLPGESASLRRTEPVALSQVPPREGAAASVPPAAAIEIFRGERGETGDGQPQSEPAQHAPATIESSGAGGPSLLTIIAVIMGSLVVPAACGALWWKARSARGATAAAAVTETVVKPAPRARRRSLEDLINDELEIRERRVALPESINLYGRPTGHRRMRIDAAHATPESHLRPNRTECEVDANKLAAEAREHAPQRAPAPHFALADRGQVNRGEANLAEADRAPAGARFSRVERAIAAAGKQTVSDEQRSAASSHTPANPSTGAEAADPFSDPLKIGLLDRVFSAVHRSSVLGAHSS